jgi:hypothetical protein
MWDKTLKQIDQQKTPVKLWKGEPDSISLKKEL